MVSQPYEGSFSKSAIYSLLAGSNQTLNTSPVSPGLLPTIETFSIKYLVLTRGWQKKPLSEVWIHCLPAGYFSLILLENLRQLSFRLKP